MAQLVILSNTEGRKKYKPHPHFQKSRRKEIITIHFMRTALLDTKANTKASQENQQPVFLINVDTEILSKILACLISNIIFKRIILYIMVKQDLSQQCKADLTQKYQFCLIHHTNKINLKTKSDHLDKRRKVFDKIHYKVIIQTLSKPGIEGNFLNLIKDVYEKKKKSYFMVNDFIVFHLR